MIFFLLPGACPAVEIHCCSESIHDTFANMSTALVTDADTVDSLTLLSPLPMLQRWDVMPFVCMFFALLITVRATLEVACSSAHLADAMHVCACERTGLHRQLGLGGLVWHTCASISVFAHGVRMPLVVGYCGGPSIPHSVDQQLAWCLVRLVPTGPTLRTGRDSAFVVSISN